ncbi:MULTISPECIES: phosphoribosylformylglycinamidine synthase subunit PurS [Brevibacillus]|uniref:Phosphoribosylformylglycinamidine synthase subunit PurS n=1 Tax=Brevibacillus laterosporus TaxID=1465 RepID=A0AAP3DKQ7_BRELA|nr:MULTISPECIES: phosphoribosylformylglycinamidine synthase subunit PurS [Brevibacillus]ATO49789.1 phosphoribosylformylglycinamidine synthase [Brevibacillus laterosporus DSM 25]AYB40063.1 phosphoribosylformylglycinamidine synthase subunit PurS [Brevibacillus laterosporus]MBG9773870.1 phosphoribosylformylglycinamidine synthase [Brevibacillus laterosporus]MBG9786846.1 phosphoribosylformylglycinamidine synthase [Brevibacillus laterosporus]MBG9800377.1 phosphoribosylformylglycinamidine synthase [B
MCKAVIYVTLRESVLDPQGHAIQGALHTLGFQQVKDARIGKYIELTLDTNDHQAAEKQVKEMCEKLLANTVIEEYRYELVELVEG